MLGGNCNIDMTTTIVENTTTTTTTRPKCYILLYVEISQQGSETHSSVCG